MDQRSEITMKEVAQKYLDKYKTISLTYIQRKFKLNSAGAKRLYDSLEHKQEEIWMVGAKLLAAKLTKNFATT